MMQSLFRLSRVSNLPTVWSNVICCCAIIFHGETLSPALIINVAMVIFSLSCFYCGGMVLNDICDEHYDQKYQAFRPIPAGLISRQHAMYFAGSLFIGAFFSLSFTPSPLGLLAGVCLFGTIGLYNLYHKDYAQSVLLMAAARALVYLVCCLAFLQHIPGSVSLIALIQGVYVLILTAVARHEQHRTCGAYSWPLIPWMIAAIALLDGVFLSIYLRSPLWLVLGVALMLLTRQCHRFIRGD